VTFFVREAAKSAKWLVFASLRGFAYRFVEGSGISLP